MLKNVIYLGLTVDSLHHGHINLIEIARKYGKILIGLMTDSAVANHKRLPLLNYSQRKKIIENISGIYKVVPQHEWDYSVNLKKYKPQYIIHGDDWEGDNYLRQICLDRDFLNEHKIKMIYVPYSKNISSSLIKKSIRSNHDS